MQGVRFTSVHQFYTSNTFPSFVTAASKETSTIQVISNYRSPYRSEYGLFESCRVWEAARATTAVSTFFEPVQIGKYGQTFIDGSLGMSNPVHLVLQEATSLWSPEGPTLLSLGCIVSIGCGAPPASFGGRASTITQTLQMIATDAEMEAQRFARAQQDMDKYFRFSNGIGTKDVEFGEIEKLSYQAATTHNYLQAQETFRKVQDCIKRLKEINLTVPVPSSPELELPPIITPPKRTQPDTAQALPTDFCGLRLMWPPSDTTEGVEAE
jgi:hypothetical protein